MKKALYFMTMALLAGCASITTGQNQSVSVETTPSGAECTLKNDKGEWFIKQTPGSVTVNRAYSDLTVSCDKKNLHGTQAFKSSTKGMAFGNILAGGIIGAAVDSSTGSAYDYPSKMSVKLIKE